MEKKQYLTCHITCIYYDFEYYWETNSGKDSDANQLTPDSNGKIMLYVYEGKHKCYFKSIKDAHETDWKWHIMQ